MNHVLLKKKYFQDSIVEDLHYLVLQLVRNGEYWIVRCKYEAKLVTLE
jgi:hypothetical protein